VTVDRCRGAHRYCVVATKPATAYVMCTCTSLVALCVEELAVVPRVCHSTRLSTHSRCQQFNIKISCSNCELHTNFVSGYERAGAGLPQPQLTLPDQAAVTVHAGRPICLRRRTVIDNT
jgi:hypothetical protein